MAASQQYQAKPLEDLPGELLNKIFHPLVDDNGSADGRKTLFSLTVMNKYLRRVTKPGLFKHVRFHDLAASPGDEVLHSIRGFMRAPELSSFARTVAIYLNRLTRPRTNPAGQVAKPYHPLTLPEFVGALTRMPQVTELRIAMVGGPGRQCLQGLDAAVHWSPTGLNIRSLTVLFSTQEVPDRSNAEPHGSIDFLEALPQLKTLCVEGSPVHTRGMTLPAATETYSHPVTVSNLTRLRLYKTCSDPHSPFRKDAWLQNEVSALNLRRIAPQLEHLSILGELSLFQVSSLLDEILHLNLDKLKYLDITDEQSTHIFMGHRALPHRTQNHQPNENRSELAIRTFRRYPQLHRICFTGRMFGEAYLWGYVNAVADSTGYISDEINETDRRDVPTAWHHGVPQTDLLRFP